MNKEKPNSKIEEVRKEVRKELIQLGINTKPAMACLSTYLRCIRYKRLLQELYDVVTHETDLPQGAANGVVDNGGEDEGVWRTANLLERVRVALLLDTKKAKHE